MHKCSTSTALNSPMKYPGRILVGIPPGGGNMAHQEEENGQDRDSLEINEDMDNKYLTFFLADEV